MSLLIVHCIAFIERYKSMLMKQPFEMKKQQQHSLIELSKQILITDKQTDRA